MRPVNLIPVDQRKERDASRRGGPLAYIVVGALVALLAGVTALVITNNQISDRKAEVATLQSENAAAEAHAAELTAYTELQNIRSQRVATVTSLADSRFDWERVVRELALVLPSDVRLTNLTGTIKPDVSVNGASEVSLRASVPGPALELEGCAKGQDGVAELISALKDIDGVTRVGVPLSELGTAAEGGTAASDASTGSASASSACEADESTATFQMVAAFDAAPISPTE